MRSGVRGPVVGSFDGERITSPNWAEVYQLLAVEQAVIPTVPSGDPVDLGAFGDALVSGVAYALAQALDEVLKQFGLPEFDLPYELSSDTIPEGTPFRYVRYSEDVEDLVHGTWLRLDGHFTRTGPRCVTDAECPAEVPVCGGTWCRAADP